MIDTPGAGPEADENGRARFDALRRRVGLLLGPGLFLLLLLLPLDGLTPEGRRLAAVMALVIVFWVTEALPLEVTALLGPVLAIMLRVGPAREVLAPFANPLIFLFIGSFILARALFVHRVNERIAYGVLSLRMVGARPTRILLAYGALAAFLSAWMSDTATTAMLVPIGVSLVVFMESEGGLPKRYGTALMLMTAYGSVIGGMATPVGTPPNIIAMGMLGEQLGVRISFVEWMLVGAPATAVFLVIAFLVLNRVGRTGVKEIPGADRIIAARRRALGPWKPGERNAVAAFGVTVSLWIGPGLLPLFLGRDHPFAVAVLASVPEAVAAMTGAILLFLLPIDSTRRSTITWKQAAQIDWGTILLFGGGLSLGALSGATGLARVVGEGITGLVPSDGVAPITFAATLFTVVLSNVMSNTAAANIALPIVISIAAAAGVNPVTPAVAAALGASISVVLPVSTPPNALVYATGRIPITRMARYGLLMAVLALALVPVVTLAMTSVADLGN